MNINKKNFKGDLLVNVSILNMLQYPGFHCYHPTSGVTAVRAELDSIGEQKKLEVVLPEKSQNNAVRCVRQRFVTEI